MNLLPGLSLANVAAAVAVVGVVIVQAGCSSGGETTVQVPPIKSTSLN